MAKKGIHSKVNKESLIALYLPDNIYQQIHFYEFPLIKNMKYKSGAKTKYDIPQYFEDMPEDFPIFCTIKEANTIRRIQNKITEEGKSKKNKSDKDKDKDKENEKRENKKKKEVRNSNNKEVNILDEPLPNESHRCYGARTG